MLLTNQRLAKLAALRVDFTHRGMLEGTCLTDIPMEIGKFWLAANISHLNSKSIDGGGGGEHVDGTAGPSLANATLEDMLVDNDDDDDDDDGVVEGDDTITSYVDLSQHVGMWCFFACG